MVCGFAFRINRHTYTHTHVHTYTHTRMHRLVMGDLTGVEKEDLGLKSNQKALDVQISVALSSSLDLFRWQFYDMLTHSRRQEESSHRTFCISLCVSH